MNMRYRYISNGIFFTAVLVLVLISILPISIFASEYVINLAQYQTGPEFPGYRIAEYFKQRVGELSDDRIEIRHFPGDLLGDWETQETHVKEGSLDMCLAPTSAVFDLETEFVRIPYLIFSWEGAKAVYGPGGGGELLLKNICDRNNTYCLGVYPEGFVIIVSKKKFTPLPGDPSIKGIKARVLPAKLEEITGKTLGFSTLSMSWGEIHSALMLGTIDAATGPAYAEATLFKDVINYQYNYNYLFGAAPWVINKDLWNKLSLEDQNILQTAMEEAIEIEWIKGRETEELAMEEMIEEGVEIIELTKEQLIANVEACRSEVWAWAEQNIYSKEFMDTIRGFAEQVPK